jgi:dimethylaniline monooxygenase (N-oxide forming)
MRKTVAVVGAGTSGLVAAKSLLEHGLHPTIFDKRGRIGGMWDPEAGRSWGSLSCTNLSRFSCCFSDFPWKSSASIFPSQKEIHGYP